MIEYIKIEHSMEITAAGDNVLHGTAQGILLLVVHGADDVLRTVKLLIVLVPRLKRNIFFSLAAAQKGVKTIIENKRSFFDPRPFCVQLKLFDSMDHLDLMIAKESKKTYSSLCVISEKMIIKESVLMALMLKTSVELSVGINIDLVEDRNNNSMYEVHDTTNEEERICRQIESNALSSTIDSTDEKGSKNSEVSAREQVQTSSIIYNTEGRISSEDFNNLYDRIRNLEPKDLDLDSSYIQWD